MPSFLLLARVVIRYELINCAWVIEGSGYTPKNFQVVFIDDDVAIFRDELRIVHELEENLHLIFGGDSDLFKDICGAI